MCRNNGALRFSAQLRLRIFILGGTSMKRITRVISAVLSTALLASVVTVAPFSVSAAEIQNNAETNITSFESNVEFVVDKNDSTESQGNTYDDNFETTTNFENRFELAQYDKSIEPVGDGEEYTFDNIKYKIIDNQIVISGYVGVLNDCQIPSSIDDIPVTQIGESAFSNSSIKQIGSHAFTNCTSLTSVFIPKSLTTVTQASYYHNGVFEGCTNLKSASFEDGTEKVLDYLFYSCSGLENVSFPRSLTQIGNRSFSSTNLQSLIIPKQIESISSTSFEKCNNLKSIEFEAGILKIPDNSYGGCTAIETIIIPDTVTEIGNGAFAETVINSISIPNSVVNIGTAYQFQTAL